MYGESICMRLNGILFALAAMCIVCATACTSQTSLHGYIKNGINRLFLDAHAPDHPPSYSRSEIKWMIQDAKTPEDFERLADYFDFQSLEFEQKAREEVTELARLLALPYHIRSYPIQLDSTRMLIREYRTKAVECSTRANAYRANAQP
jgi:hypothetical protein